MKRNLLTVFALVLLVTGSVWAGSKHSGASYGSGESKGLSMHGSIVSSSGSELVLSSKINGKSEQETFVVNPQTKITGDIKDGAMASVHYKEENGQKVATSINIHKMMASKSK
jgi:hypothetical protein